MSDRGVLGVILAGGASRRFGAEKSAALLGGRPLLDRSIERARPQVGDLLLNSNDPRIGSGCGLERLADHVQGEGPLAGILAALHEAGRRGFAAAASFACDTPFFPRNTVSELSSTLHSSKADYAVASCNGTVHRIFALWPLACRTQLAEAFSSGARSMKDVEQWLAPGFADFPGGDGPCGDPFFNINTPDDLATAQRWLTRESGPNDSI